MGVNWGLLPSFAWAAEANPSKLVFAGLEYSGSAAARWPSERGKTMAWHLHASRRVQVNERDEDVDTHVDVRTGDTLIFHANGSIWAGVWWTGLNGPNGWNHKDHDPKFPTAGRPSVPTLGKTRHRVLPDWSLCTAGSNTQPRASVSEDK